jgi:hypothetical protein
VVLALAKVGAHLSALVGALVALGVVLSVVARRRLPFLVSVVPVVVSFLAIVAVAAEVPVLAVAVPRISVLRSTTVA